MSTDMKKSAGIYPCLNAYPILTSIMDSLSATDVSSFIHAFNISLDSTTINKYINVLRDIPEHLHWIENMTKVGNRVMLIGSDLERLKHRIMNPFTYDRKNEQPLCIWLAVVPLQMIKNKDFSRSNIMTWDGNFKAIRDLVDRPGGYMGLFGPPGRNTFGDARHPTTMFICRFDHMKTLSNNDKESEWFISTIPNENNIKIVYFASWFNGNRSLTAYIETCLHANPPMVRCTNMITNTNHIEGEEMNVPLVPPTYIYKDETEITWYNVNLGVAGTSKARAVDEMITWLRDTNILLYADTPFVPYSDTYMFPIPFFNPEMVTSKDV
jgi:hypothetical protein